MPHPALLNSSAASRIAGEPHARAWRAAASACSLLITGETGVGKGYLARWVHQHSPRRLQPFVPVNCGAIPEGLVDSHLFGHARGAFSGATSEHVGLIRAANGGTLLLDEIGDLPSTAQVRLLRLLEEREVQPVGFSQPVNVDVRIIAATSCNLADLVQSGSFRQDLYFRLDVVRLHIEPLRRRAHEIMDLIESINAELAISYAQPKLRFDAAATEALCNSSWPGNIRQLRAVLERLHVLCGPCSQPISVQQLVEIAHLPQADHQASRPALRLNEARLGAVSEVVEACCGNISRAAHTLGVHRSTLYRWMAQRPATA